DPATEVGPMVTATARDNIEAQVEDARAKGATILCGAERVVGPGGTGHPGYFYRPTVITDITPEMRVATEEVFGPVALLFRVASADDALRLANGTEFGLGSSVWTTEPDEQLRFVNDLEAGLVFVNSMVASIPALPFGGIKSSGHGRELSAHGIREFCNIKAISIS
ncbi:MAG TPA: aldehyde dehydrogenase family protein, partial [Acidimicrobiales bacterium]